MANPDDPDLQPVPAAKAFIAAQAAEEARRVTQTGTAEQGNSMMSTAPAKRPVIAPAQPEQWSKRVDLGFPLLVDGVEMAAIDLRRLTARDVADLVLAGNEGVSLNAAARAMICGVHPDVLDALAAEDAEAVARACLPFLPAAIADLAEAMTEALNAEDLDDAA